MRCQITLAFNMDANVSLDFSPEEAGEPDRGNVVDLMAALKKSLGQRTDEAPKARRSVKIKAEPPAKVPKKRAAVAPPLKPARKRA